VRKLVDIFVDVEDSLVSTSASIGDPELSREACWAIIDRMNAEALKIMRERALRRRFKPPIVLRVLDTPESSPEIISYMWQAWDLRGRKALMRVEIAK
jgi:hypothetical protein